MLQFHAMNRVFHHHYGAIDDHAEVDGPKAHQVGADAKKPHTEETNQHRKRDDGGRDNRGAKVAQKEQQDHGDENKALEKILLHGVDGAVNDERLIVERNNLHTRR